MGRTQPGRRPGSKNIEGNGQDLSIHVIWFTAGDVHSHQKSLAILSGAQYLAILGVSI